MAKGSGTVVNFSPLLVREAELILVNGLDYALALKYAPGETPQVLLKGKNGRARDIIWAAQEFEIPIIELTSIDEEFYRALKPGEEIAENLYKPVAQALALLYRTKSSPHRLAFVKTLRKRPGALMTRNNGLVEKYSSFLEVSLLSLELGKDLYEHIDMLRGPLDSLRQRIALEIGIVIPEINAKQNSRISPLGYKVKMREIPVYHGEIESTLESKDHVFQIVNRLRLLISREAWQLLGYSEVEALLGRLKKYNTGLYKELFPGYFSISSLRFILRNLLKEGISIRDLSKIMEVLKENLHLTRDPDLLTELVRTAFAPYLCHKYKSREGFLEVLLLDPELERVVIHSIRESSQVRWLDLNAEDGLRLLTSLGEELKKTRGLGLAPILLCSPGLRRFLKRLLDNAFPDLPVLSYSEIIPFTEVRSVGVVK